MVDNLDVLMAVLDGVRAAGVQVDIAGCDLTERRMYVKVRALQVAEYAPELPADCHSPFTACAAGCNRAPNRPAQELVNAIRSWTTGKRVPGKSMPST